MSESPQQALYQPGSQGPKPGRPHERASRGQLKGGQRVVPESKLVAGRFGRMFRNLPSYEPSDETIGACAEQKIEPADASLDNPTIAAGFTYLGQFIDHDLTFDPVSSLDRQNDPDGLRNFRTPNFDLDSVYGLGRADQPYLYQRQPNGDPAKLLVGKGEDEGEDDLPRNVDGVALIGDPRNDENIIVSQLQLAFIKLHNRIADDIRADRLTERLWGEPALADDDYVFYEAQRLTRWHYQWVVLTEFLPKICSNDLIGRLVDERHIEGVGTRRRVRELEHYRPEQVPYIPVEWSVAAYRYGHSQIRPSYNLNPFLQAVNADIPIFVPEPTEENRLRHLGGGRPLPGRWTLDWRFFFEQNLPGTDEDDRIDPQMTRLIDTKLAPELQHVPVSDGSRVLAERNLRRGKTMGLPSGQAVARRMAVAPLSQDDLGIKGEAPLWFYILREAEKRHGGEHLGAVGGRIVAEVFLGILKADPFSFLRTEPAWQPVLPAAIARDLSSWGIADLLAYAVPEDGRRFPPPGP